MSLDDEQVSYQAWPRGDDGFSRVNPRLGERGEQRRTLHIQHINRIALPFLFFYPPADGENKA